MYTGSEIPVVNLKKKTRVIGGSPLLAGAALDAIKLAKRDPGPDETVETIDSSFE
jgi:hypothetical protein